VTAIAECGENDERKSAIEPEVFMALTPRERLIAIGVAGVAGLYALNAFAVAPYRAKQAELNTQIDAQQTKVDQARKAIKRQAALRPDWDKMGVKVDPSEADTRLSHFLREWAQESRLNISSVKPERTASENKGFTQITTHATATGRQKDIVRLMWAMANSPVPVKVNEMTVGSKKDGTDELQMTFSVSTLCVDPEANKPAVRGGRQAVAGARPAAGGRDPS
jgi:hypothetical protein